MFNTTLDYLLFYDIDTLAWHSLEEEASINDYPFCADQSDLDTSGHVHSMNSILNLVMRAASFVRISHLTKICLGQLERPPLTNEVVN